jgi:hypothetical protein
VRGDAVTQILRPGATDFGMTEEKERGRAAWVTAAGWRSAAYGALRKSLGYASLRSARVTMPWATDSWSREEDFQGTISVAIAIFVRSGRSMR